MGAGSSEEKSEPASAKKLQEQREKGQVAKGPDLMTAITTGTLIGYVLLQSNAVMGQGEALIDAASRAVSMPFENAAPLMMETVQSALIVCALAPLVVATVAAILGSLLINKGFLFSLEPLMPKPEKLNPIEGLKNLYKVKAWIELAKALVKAVLLGTALFVIARAAVGPLLEVPSCSPGCIPAMLRSMMTPLLVVAALFYLASGILDTMVQKWLFLRENRMTKTDVKHERKDTNGNPEIKKEQNRLRREAAKAGPLGLARATCLICGTGLVVGLRYVRGETKLPVVVCGGSGQRSAEMIRDARLRGLPLHFDSTLCADLTKNIKPGQAVTQPFFSRVAVALKRARA